MSEEIKKAVKLEDEEMDTVSGGVSNQELAYQVMHGNWGNGDERRRRLTAAGYDYNAVQSIVNQLAKNIPTVNNPTLNIAREVIDGRWGNGDERIRRLTAAGYNYNEVQALVNQLLK